MALLALETNDKLTALDIPDAYALVERTSRDEEIVRRDGNSGDAVLNGEVGNLGVGLEVPEADAAITGAGCNDPAVTGKVQTVDILLVASELVFDCARGNVPDTDDLVLGTGSQVLAVRAEAYAPDVQVAILGETTVLEVRNRVSSFDVEDLGRTVATGGDIAAIETEAHATNHTLVGQVVNQVDVKHTSCPRVENGVPVIAFPLELRRQLLNLEISQDIALSQRHRHLVLGHQGILLVVRRRSRSRNLG